MGGNKLASASNEIEILCKELVIEVPDRMQTTLRPEICIYHVPANLRILKEDAYTPQQISIGPIHHDKLRGMETQKRRYFKEFCNRVTGETPEEKLKNQEMFWKELVSTIKDREVDIRNCYEDEERRYFKEFCNRVTGETPEEKLKNQEMFRKELVSTIKDREVDIRNCYEDEESELCNDPKVFPKMVLWDAVFIFQLFLKTREYKQDGNKSQDKYKYDFILGKPWLRAAIQRDLILLENQLPFSILETLYSLATKYIETDCSSFLEISCQYFENYNKNKTMPEKILHFTDLVRFFLSSKHPKPKFDEPIKDLYTATWLHQAGLKFKPLPNECLLDIRAWRSAQEREGNSIKKAELHVPPLEIDDNTECLLRNLMALEQCYYPDQAYICHYVKFLDFLVDINEDADLLIKSKVIINRLGESVAVAELINKLCLEIVEVSSCYNDVATKLNDYYKSCWNRSWAYLRRVYFRNVWIGTGTAVGLIVLFITLAQFVLSFL